MNPRAWSLVGVMSMLACSSDNVPANGGATQDAGATPDAGPQCSVPEGPYGMAVGSNFPRTVLTDCTTEEPYVLYDKAEFCGAQVTFISLAAGW
jgi:hypothetical protein